MKCALLPTLIGISILVSAGCSVSLGGRPGTAAGPPTVGQQLIDLQRAREAGAVTTAEYQVEKSKLLNGN